MYYRINMVCSINLSFFVTSCVGFKKFQKVKKVRKKRNIYLWTPHFGSMRFSLNDEFDFLFWKIDFIWLWKLTWSRHLFLFYFLKGKQNKKENPKRDSLFWKRWSVKNRIGLGGQVTYQEGAVMNRSTPLSP